MALRQNAIPVGAIEYLLRGCGCDPAKERAIDLEKVAEREAGMRADHQHEHGHDRSREQGRERDAAGYFEAAVRSGEPDGVWMGTGMEALGLAARDGQAARPDDVRAVFGQLRRPGALGSEGEADWIGAKPRQFPSKAEKLAKLIALEPGATVTDERRLELEEQVAQGAARKAVAYYDWTFSPVKSVSVYYAALRATGDLVGAAQVRAAHEQAVAEAMAYAEQHVAWSRNGSHGRNADGDRVGEFVRGTGLTMVAFGHSTSREDEPQLHTHVALLNRIAFLLESGESKIGALDSRGFFAMKQAIEAVYTRSLEDQLTEDRGVVFETRPDGKAREIAGIGAELRDEASTRRTQVLVRLEELVAEYVERTGHDPAQATRHRLAETAALSTRPDKGVMSGPAGVDAWGAERLERLAEALERVADAGQLAEVAALVRGLAEPDRGPEQQSGREPGQERGRDVGRGHGPVAADGARVAGGHGPVADVAATVGPVATLDERVAAAVAAGVADVQAAYPTFVLGTLVAAIDAHLPASSTLGIARTERGAYLERLALAAVSPGAAGGGGVAGGHEVVQLTGHEPVAVPGALLRAADGRPRFRPHMDQRYTTAAHLAREDALVARLAETATPALDDAGLAAADQRMTRLGLSADQRAAALGVLASQRRGSILIGPAGTGKSRTVMALAHEWAAATGGHVYGVATSQRATMNLESDGLRALNTTNFLLTFEGDPETGAAARDQLGADDLVVIDEASMSSTDHLERITRLVAAAGARVLPVGDHAQLQSVGAGGMFAVLADKAGPGQRHELTEVHRFTHDWEKAASLRLRDGDPGVFGEYAAYGRVHTGTLEEVQDGAARAYVTDRVAGRSALLIVSTHEQARQLSQQVRRELVDLGRVGAQTVAHLGNQTELGLGDVVLALRNDYRARVDPAIDADGRAGVVRPVMNKELYTIVGSQRDGTLLVRDAHGATAHLSEAYVREHLALGYAVTGHGAQGVTVDVGHGIADRDATRESTYTQSTRGRTENHLWMPTERAPDVHDPERIHELAAARFAEIMETRAVEPAAVEVRDRYAAQAGSLTSMSARLQVELTAAARAHHEQVLDQLAADGVLDPDQLARLRSPVERSDRERLEHTLHAAALAGHDVAHVLDTAIRERELASADSVGDVLRHRVDVATGRAGERGRAGSWADIVAPHTALQHTAQPSPDGRDVDVAVASDLEGDVVAARGHYLAEVAALSDVRQAEIGARALDEAPEWAVALLGPVPDAEQDAARDEWARAASVIGAARETLAVPDGQVSLGEAPSPQRALERHWWRAAMDEVTTAPEAAGRDWRAADDAALYQARERWSRELDAAPEWVGDDLADTHRLARDMDGDAVRDAVRAIRDEHTDPGHAAYLAHSADLSRHLAERYRAQAADLEVAHQTRQTWWTDHGAQLDRDSRAASAELARRGLPLERGVEHPAEDALEHDAGTVAPAGVDRMLSDEQDRADDVVADRAVTDVERDLERDVPESTDQREDRSRSWDRFVAQLRDEHGPRLDPEHQLDDDALTHARAAEIAGRAQPLPQRELAPPVDEHLVDEHLVDEHLVDEHQVDEHQVDEHQVDEPDAEAPAPALAEPEPVELGRESELTEPVEAWAQRVAEQAAVDEADAASAAAQRRRAEQERVAAQAEQRAVEQREARAAEQEQRQQAQLDVDLDAHLDVAEREPALEQGREHELERGLERGDDLGPAVELDEGYELDD